MFSRTMTCWLYLIRKFPAKLLEKPHVAAYHNTPEQPYRERSERDVNINARDDLEY